MKSICRIWTVALALLVAGHSHAEHYKVFILGGQSNMYGADSKLEALPEALQQRQEDVLFYSGSEFSKLKPGSGRVFGPEITFGRAIADALPRENFYLIKHSDGGTSLWNEWNLRTTAQYQADLTALIADMRSRWGTDLPFFFSRLSVLQTARPVEAVRTAQEYVAAADPDTHLIDTDGMEMQKDNLHFTGQGYIDLGYAYAQAYLNTLRGDAKSAGEAKDSGSVEKTAIGANGVIDGAAMVVSSSDGSFSFSTFDQKGHPAWHPNRTVDGSGLEAGEHGSERNTGWMTERIDPADAFIQWDLGASYRLDSIHVWNLKVDDDNDAGIRSVDVYGSPKDDPGVGWRNTSPPKPLDIDGDHIHGTDGWRVGHVGNAVSDPPYARTAQVAPNANAHGQWDTPLDPSGKDTTQGILHDAGANAGETSAPLLTFEITEEPPAGEVLRLGLLFDVQGGPNTATYTLSQTFGGTATATTPEHEWTGEGLDVAFFDLTDLRPGYTFEVTCTTISTPNHPGPFEQVVGITFDTSIPHSNRPPSK